MRNKNIFVRKETQFSLEHGSGLPVFANVKAFVGGLVHYAVDWPVPQGKRDWRWNYADSVDFADNRMESGTYILPLENFLARFAPDVFDEYARFAG